LAEGLFEPRMSFYSCHLAHIVALEVAAWCLLWTYGTPTWSSGWFTFALSCLLFVTAQAQAGWLQHDFGHLSVFSSTGTNHKVHTVIMGFLKAASADWWNWRHYQHHSKPNVLHMDPDIKMAHFFVIGDVIPIKWGEKRKGLPFYNWQHRYWFFVGPPFLLPVYFHIDVISYIIRKRDWVGAAWIAAFFARWWICGTHLFGFFGVIGFYFLIRTLESHWFVWVTQMNHLPMHTDYHKGHHWFESQVRSTCNVEESRFNDWFTGHLNFQIEHHLFPTMPRHNYYKIAPRVRALCKKHGLDYQCKTLLGAFADIVGMLQKSGELWYDAYHMNDRYLDMKKKAK